MWHREAPGMTPPFNMNHGPTADSSAETHAQPRFVGHRPHKQLGFQTFIIMSSDVEVPSQSVASKP